MVMVLPKEFGKPRPALVIQSDAFPHTENITVLPITSQVVEELTMQRFMVEPSKQNGLKIRSQIRLDAATTTRRAKIGKRIGKLDDSQMLEVGRSLTVFLGLA